MNKNILRSALRTLCTVGLYRPLSQDILHVLLESFSALLELLAKCSRGLTHGSSSVQRHSAFPPTPPHLWKSVSQKSESGVRERIPTAVSLLHSPDPGCLPWPYFQDTRLWLGVLDLVVALRAQHKNCCARCHPSARE